MIKIMRKIIFVIAAFSCMFVINACKSSQNTKENGNKDLVEKYWKLDQIMGTEISDLETKLPKEAYITLKAGENRIVGNLGCNGFSGVYELGEGNRIRFSQVVSTQMMCMDMTVEDKLKQVLTTADSYYVKNDTLILNRARMAPLARFVAVYMQ
jgi:heat shock protein HslJ